ncbi:diol dehydratase small subunit [Tropicibacter sp. Alg240-R139]|uniref:diol dehydratase small subunit n=1 Tax=Tropicibacter sp. Alg240-R139 TaxID=2305991 RepID=UPI0013E092FD|nr:diol dehydratase small subunit [Tropicibacter sp. Alg240-R139]
MTDKPEIRYPLGVHHRDEISAKSGRPLRDLTLDQVQQGNAQPDDLSASTETLKMQAQIARESGYDEVAANLTRAAEMAGMPNVQILEIYEALRPGRSTYYQLLSLSQQITSMYGAENTGGYIREAAEVYRDTGLLKDEDR